MQRGSTFSPRWGRLRRLSACSAPCAQNNSSLAVVAPGISEALFATAIGLFAAIPAVIAYNRFSASVNRYEAILQRFADRFNANLGRELERV